MERVYVIGVSMTPFGKFLDKSVRDLTREAVHDALRDASCGVDLVDSALFSNAAQGAMDGQHSVRGKLALRDFAFDNIPIVNVENACASASTAFHLAVNYIKAGMSDVALAVGAEKTYSNDKEKSLAVFNSSWDA